MIKMIWAMDENWLIGKDNRLPWHLPEDLNYFKEMTKEEVVIMGDMTYESLKGYYKKKPLPFKKIYVANLNHKMYEDAICVTDIITFLTQAKEDIMVIGGRAIYQLALPYADVLYITHVLNHYDGNVFFPKFKLSDYQISTYQIKPELIFATYRRV